MTTPADPGSKSFIEHARSKQAINDRTVRMRTVREGIEACSKALARGRNGYYATAAEILRDDVLPALEHHVPKRLVRYGDEMEDQPGWDWPALKQFRDDPDAVLAALESAGTELSFSSLAAGQLSDDREQARQTVQGALSSAAAIAEVEDLVSDELKSRVDAVGFHIKLGEWVKKPWMDFGDPVGAVSDDRGAPKSFITGGTGTGKTTAASRHFEDYGQETFREDGRDYKLLDYIGLNMGENWCHDMPQLQEGLRRARVDQDQPPSFEEIDDFDPELEILVPLTTDLDGKELPYNTTEDEWVPTPFTIPASDISEDLFVALLSGRVSPSKMHTMRDAYRAVDRQWYDWSLRDIADEVLSRDELSDKHKLDTVRVLRTLQDDGFIRTRDCPHAIDWERIWTDTDLITSFSQIQCESAVSRYFLIAYLIDSHFEKRRSAGASYPHAVVWLREAWEYAMHQNKRNDKGATQKALLEFIVDKLTSLVLKNRHVATTLLADSQNPKHTEKSFREEFNRFVIFEADDELLKEFFSWTMNDGWETFKGSLTGVAGEGGVIGQTEPSIRNPDSWGLSPVQFTPPSWHVPDTDEDKAESAGWHVRCQYFDGDDGRHNEEMRRVDWDFGIPEDREIPTRLNEDEDGEPRMSTADVTPSQLHRYEARRRNAKGESLRDIRENIPNNPDTGRPYGTSTIGEWTEDIDKGSGEIPGESPLEALQ